MHYCCNVRIHLIATSGTYFGQDQPCVVGVADNLGQITLGDIKESIQRKHQRSRHELCGSPWRRIELTERETLMNTRWVRPQRQDRIHSSTAAVVFQATNASFLADDVKKKFPYNILTVSKVMLTTNTLEVRDMLSKMKCSLV